MNRSFKTIYALSCFLLITTSASAAINIQGSPIPLSPEDDLARTPHSLERHQTDLEQGKERELLKEYENAAQLYKQSGINGCAEAFIHLGYLYEGRHLILAKTIEERRLIDGLAAYYIEKGGNDNKDHTTYFQSSIADDDYSSEEDEPYYEINTLTGIENDVTLSIGQKLLAMGRWYENQGHSEETLAQKRLRYAYAGRYFEEAALHQHVPEAYTALGHMYYFGRGIDISDPETAYAARLQAKDYYKEGAKEQTYKDSDPVSQFMMGFLLEQKGTQEASEKSTFYYQMAASDNHPLAAFRLGIRYEQGQEQALNVFDYYKQAELYLTQAEEIQRRDHQSIPKYLRQLVNMPDSLDNKITLIKALQENPEALEVPVYSLIDHAFSDCLKKYIADTLMPYWVHLSLTKYATDHHLTYNSDPEQTRDNIKDISMSFNGVGLTQTVPDLTAVEQKMLNFQNAKIYNAAAAQHMRLLSVKQRLASNEDEKWAGGVESEEISHGEKWFQSFLPLAKALNNLTHSFDGHKFLETLQSSIEGLSVENHCVNSQTSLWPEGFFEKLNHQLDIIILETQILFKALPLYNRALSHQLLLYKNLQEIKSYIGATVISEDLLDTLWLARSLMKETSKGDEETDKLIKHFQSARALKAYAAEQNVSLEAAKEDLNQKAKECLSILSPDLHYFSVIGYDVIQNLLKARQEQGNQIDQPYLEASRLYREELILKLANDHFDQEWIVKDYFDISYLTGEAREEAGTLTHLFQKVKEIVDEKERAQPVDQPRLNLKALTYEDPFIGIYGNVVVDFFKNMRQEAYIQFVTGELGLSKEKIYESFLDQEIINIQNIIRPLFTRQDMGLLNGIIDILQSVKNIFQRIDRKQNLLFIFKKNIDWDILDQNQIYVVLQDIIHGSSTRCADGQASYAQKTILEYIMNHPEDYAIKSLNEKIGLSLSFLMQDYKSTFIQGHGSPFKLGNMRATNPIENRTSIHTLLTEMLRLPFNIIGSYGKVLYPNFALNGLEESQTTLQITSLTKRFLEGGEITYKDYRITEEAGMSKYHDMDEDGTPESYNAVTVFKGLTFPALGTLLREAFIEIKSSPPVPQKGLLPSPRVFFSFSKETIEDFLQHDPILSSFYSTFINSNYTLGNIFFDSKAVFEQGKEYQHFLKDAALLRFLEVGGYATVPEGFYETIGHDWTFNAVN